MFIMLVIKVFCLRDGNVYVCVRACTHCTFVSCNDVDNTMSSCACVSNSRKTEGVGYHSGNPLSLGVQ